MRTTGNRAMESKKGERFYNGRHFNSIIGVDSGTHLRMQDKRGLLHTAVINLSGHGGTTRQAEESGSVFPLLGTLGWSWRTHLD